MSYPTFLPRDELVETRQRSLDEFVAAQPSMTEPLRVRIAQAEFEKGTDLDADREAFRVRSHQQAFDDFVMQDTASREMRVAEANTSGGIVDGPGALAPESTQDESPVGKALAFMKGMGNEGAPEAQPTEKLTRHMGEQGPAIEHESPPPDPISPGVPMPPLAGGLRFPIMPASLPPPSRETQEELIEGRGDLGVIGRRETMRMMQKQGEHVPAMSAGGLAVDDVGRYVVGRGGRGKSTVRQAESVPGGYVPDPRDFAPWMQWKKDEAQGKVRPGHPKRMKRPSWGVRAEGEYYEEKYQEGLEAFKDAQREFVSEYNLPEGDPAWEAFYESWPDYSPAAESMRAAGRGTQMGRPVARPPKTTEPRPPTPLDPMERGMWRQGAGLGETPHVATFRQEGVTPPALPPGSSRGMGQGRFGGEIEPPGDAPIQPTGPRVSNWARIWDRTRNVMESQGEDGKELARRVWDAREYAQTQAGEWITQRIPAVRAIENDPAVFRRFWDAVEEGEELRRTPQNRVLVDAVAQWRALSDEVFKTARRAGVQVSGYLENYLPHRWAKGVLSPKNDAEHADYLVRTGQAETRAEAFKRLNDARNVVSQRRHGNLEQERMVDLPGYEKTPDALFGYLESAARRIGEVRELGDNDSVADTILQRISEAGGDSENVRRAFHAAVRGNVHDPMAQDISSGARMVMTITKMGLSALANVSQSINTASVAGVVRTLRAIPGALKSDAAEEALRDGVILDSVLRDVREGTGITGGGRIGKAVQHAREGEWKDAAGEGARAVTAPYFLAVEKFNRTLSLRVGKGYGDELVGKALDGDKLARKALTRLGLDAEKVIAQGGLTPRDAQIAGRRLVNRTQFQVDPQDLPGWASHPLARVLTQFKTFGYNQTAFIGRELIKPAIEDRDFRPLARFLLLGLPVGWVVKETRNELAGRESEENPWKAASQYLGAVGGLGLVQDVAAGIIPQNSRRLPPNILAQRAAGSLLGPSIGTGMEVAGGLAHAIQGALNPPGPNAQHPWNPLLRTGVRHVPVAGPMLQNYFVPYSRARQRDDEYRIPAGTATTTRGPAAVTRR